MIGSEDAALYKKDALNTVSFIISKLTRKIHIYVMRLLVFFNLKDKIKDQQQHSINNLIQKLPGVTVKLYLHVLTFVHLCILKY